MNYYTVVGLKYYIEEWGLLKLGSIVTLKKEPDNKYDKKAVACYYNDKKIGYVSSQENHNFKNEGEYTVCLCQGFNQPILISVKGEI
jgi:hypothetical protein